VLDEADRMLDMGFIHDVRKVIALLPRVRQTLFFSATMPPEAQRLADVLLKDPETVQVAALSTPAERIEQSVYHVEKADKRALLVDVLRDQSMKRVLVFSRTKHGANRIAEHLEKARISAEAIHGNKSQNARERALANFKSGAIRVMVATDIAARGIDIEDITHIVNFDLPEVPETYVHRIGRTARAGASGTAISFCDREERDLLRDIERLVRFAVPVVEGHPYDVRGGAPVSREPQGRGGAGGRGGSPYGHRGPAPSRAPGPHPSAPPPPRSAPSSANAAGNDWAAVWSNDSGATTSEVGAHAHERPRPAPPRPGGGGGGPPGAPGGGRRRRRGGRRFARGPA
jgi:ATP-dependent RNA helicase RhlE